jgi:hypothetical protein
MLQTALDWVFHVDTKLGGLAADHGAWIYLILVAALIGVGYAFGNVQWIQDRLSAVLLGIVAVSVLPAIIGWAKERKSRPAHETGEPARRR